MSKTRKSVVHATQVPNHPMFVGTATHVSGTAVTHMLPPKATLPRGTWPDGKPALVTDAANAALRDSTRHLGPGLYWIDKHGKWKPFVAPHLPPTSADFAFSDACEVKNIDDRHHPTLRSSLEEGAPSAEMQQGVFVKPNKILKKDSYVVDYITCAWLTTGSEYRPLDDEDAEEAMQRLKVCVDLVGHDELYIFGNPLVNDGVYVNDSRADVSCKRKCPSCKPYNDRAVKGPNCQMYLVAHVHDDSDAPVSLHVMIQALCDVVGPSEVLIDYSPSYWDKRKRPRRSKVATLTTDAVDTTTQTLTTDADMTTPADVDMTTPTQPTPTLRLTTDTDADADVDDVDADADAYMKVRREGLVDFFMKHAAYEEDEERSSVLTGHELQIPTLNRPPCLMPGVHEYVRRLHMDYHVVTDDFMKQLIGQMPSLRNLDVWDIDITGAMYTDAKSIEWLSRLSIETEKYELTSLAKLPLLCSLRAKGLVSAEAYVEVEEDDDEAVDLMELPEVLHAAVTYIAADHTSREYAINIGECCHAHAARAISLLAVLKNEARKHAMSVFMTCHHAGDQCPRVLSLSGMTSRDIKDALPSVCCVFVKA